MSLRPNQTQQPSRPCKDLDCTWPLFRLLYHLRAASSAHLMISVQPGPSPLRRHSLHWRDDEDNGEGNGSREGAKIISRDSNRDVEGRNKEQGCAAEDKFRPLDKTTASTGLLAPPNHLSCTCPEPLLDTEKLAQYLPQTSRMSSNTSLTRSIDTSTVKSQL